MLHQTIPAYTGSQPFLYACYCDEDEALAFPILARMYNEGFRIWCAQAGGITEGFRSMQRLSACSCALMFFSKNTLDAIRFGDAEMRAVAANARLRTVVRLDSVEADSSLFALSVPDTVTYIPSSDASFWLHIYSSDALEKCRGPWPEKKLLLRDAVIGDAEEEAVSEEYRELEAILGDGHVPQPEPEPETSAVPRDDDDLVYLPLDKVQAAKSGLELEYDAVLEMLDRVVRQQENLAVELDSVADELSRQNTADKSVAVNPSAEVSEPASDPKAAPVDPPAPAWSASWGGRTAAPAPLIPEDDRFPEHDLMQGDPVPKTDRSVEITDNTADAAAIGIISSPAAEKTAAYKSEPIENAVPEETPAGNTEADEMPAETPADNEILPPEPVMFTPVIIVPAEPKTEEEPDETEPDEAEPEEIASEEAEEEEQSTQTIVPVLVKRQVSTAVHVVPVKRLRVMLPAESVSSERRAKHFTAPAAPGFKRIPITGSIEFEQYVRNIALSAIAQQENAAGLAPSADEAATPVSARKYRGRSSETVQTGFPAPVMPTVNGGAPCAVAPSETPEKSAAEGEKVSPRKNRHPHRPGGWLSGVIAALRGQRAENADLIPAADGGADPADSSPDILADKAPQPTSAPVFAAAHPGNTTLEAAVENFVEKNPPRSVTVTVVPRSRRSEE